jgi:hypothetical protein
MSYFCDIKAQTNGIRQRTYETVQHISNTLILHDSRHRHQCGVSQGSREFVTTT